MVYTLVSSSESSEAAAAATRWVEVVEEAAYRKSLLLTNVHENEWKTTE